MALATAEAGVHDRRVAHPGDGAPARGRRDRPGGRVPRERLPQAQGRGAPGGRAARAPASSDAHLASIDLGAGSGRAMLGRLRRGRPASCGRCTASTTRRRARTATCAGRSRRSWHGVETGLAAGARGGLASRSRASGVCSWGVDYGLVDAAGRARRGPDLLPRPPHRRARSSACSSGCRGTRSSRAPGSSSCRSTRSSSSTPTRAPACPARRARLLMIPDLVHHALCGSTARRVHERVDHAAAGRAHARVGRRALRAAASCPRALMPELVEPGTPLGELRPALRREARDRARCG